MSKKIDRRFFLKNSTLVTGATAAFFGLEGGEMVAFQEIQSGPMTPSVEPPGDQNFGPVARKAYPTPVGAGPMPMGKLGDKMVSRLIIGHERAGHSRDLLYTSQLANAYNTDEKMLQTYQKAEELGITTHYLRADERHCRLAKEHKRRGGKANFIAQVITAKEVDIKRDVDMALECGAFAMHIRGNETDRFVRERSMDIAVKGLEYIKSNKCLAGLAAHMLAGVVTAEKMGVPTDYYMKTVHSHEYWSVGPKLYMNPRWTPTPEQPVQLEYATVFDNIWDLTPVQTKAFMEKVKKPWLGYKVLAAGALSPWDGFEYAFANGTDFVVVGMNDFQLEYDVKVLKDVLAKKLDRTRPWYS